MSRLEQGVEIFAAVHFVTIGLSHLLRPREWIRFFEELRARGTSGAFLNGMLSLGMGSVIVAFHNIWTWPGAVLTIIGWLYVLKSLVVFSFPATGLRSMKGVAENGVLRLRAAGVLLLALGAFMVWVAAGGVLE